MESALQTLVPTLLIQGSIVFSGILSARLLGPEARGYLALAILIPTVTALVGTFGLPSAVAYYTARAGSYVRPSRSVVAFLIALTVLLTIVNAGLILLLFSSDPPWVLAAVAPTVVVTPFIVFQVMVTAIHQGLGQFTLMNVTRVTPFVCWGGGILLLGATRSASLSSACLILTLAYAVGVAVALATASRLRAARDGPPLRVRALVRFGGQGFVGTISPLENLRLDQLVVWTFQGPAALGYYSTAQAFYTLPRLVGQSIGMLALPRTAALPKIRRAHFIRQVFAVAAAAIGLLAVVLALAVPWLVVFLFGEEYAPSIPVAQVLMVTGFMLAMRRLAADLLRGDGRPSGDSLAEIASWPVLAIALTLAATRGPLAVAIATAVASFVALLVAGWLLSRGLRNRSVPQAATRSPDA